MKEGNKQILDEALGIIEKKSYFVNDEQVLLKLSDEQMKQVEVYLPERIMEIQATVDKIAENSKTGKCKITCDDFDTFTMARKMSRQYGLTGESNDKKCLVLNFANPTHPGGGVRNGAKAQEEDLCRCSTLLPSLESEKAREYYEYNYANKRITKEGNDYGTSALMLTPNVEIFRNRRGELLDATTVVAVVTSAAPIMHKNWLEDSYAKEYCNIIYKRISAILTCAAHYGYRHLVLGAWGCGAFHNDPDVVAPMFARVLREFTYAGKKTDDLFERISFAVPYSERNPDNYLAFEEVFGEGE